MAKEHDAINLSQGFPDFESEPSQFVITLFQNKFSLSLTLKPSFNDGMDAAKKEDYKEAFRLYRLSCVKEPNINVPNLNKI